MWQLGVSGSHFILMLCFYCCSLGTVGCTEMSQNNRLVYSKIFILLSGFYFCIKNYTDKIILFEMFFLCRLRVR